MPARFAGFALAGTLTFVAAGALAQAEAERRLDAAIERLRAALGPDTRLTIGQRQIDPVTGRARLGDIVLTEGGRQLTVAEAVLQDLADDRLGLVDLRGIRMQESKSDRVEAARLLVAELPLPAPGTELDLARLSFARLELEALRAESQAHGLIAIGRLAAQGYAPGSLRQASAEGLEYRGTDPDPQSFRLGRLTLSGLAFPEPGAEVEPRAFRLEQVALEGASLRDPGKAVGISLDRLALRGWAPGSLADAAAEGLRLEAELGAMGPGEMRLARLALSGIDGAGTLNALMEDEQPPAPQPGTPQRVALEGFALTAGGQPLFALDRLAMDGTMDAAGNATGALALEGLRASLPAGSVPPLEDLGYREIAGGMELRGTAQTEEGRLGIAPLRLSWQQAGTLTVTAELEGIATPAAGTALDAAAQAAQFAEARLVGMTLRWRDEGLTGRAIAQQARAQRQPEARLREQWAQLALTMPVPGEAPRRPAGQGVKAPATAEPDSLAPIRQAIAAFIRQPAEIEFSARPPKPIAFEAMSALGAGGPAAAVRMLGITARVP